MPGFWLAARIEAAEVLGPDAEDHLLVTNARGRIAVKGKRGCLAVGGPDGQRRLAAVAGHFGRNEVHGGRAHEAGDEHVGRPVVDLSRLVELLDAALMHDRDARRQRHRFDLVVGHVDGGLADLLVQLLDLHAHLDAQLGIEIGQRFVEQEEQGIAHQRPAHGDALALAAGQLPGLALQQMLDLQQPGDARQRFGLHGLGTPRDSMPKVMFSLTVIVG